MDSGSSQTETDVYDTSMIARNTRRRMLRIVVLLPLAVILGARILSQYSKPATTMGHLNNRLADCPDKPNCVNSQSADPRHAIAPIQISESTDQTWQALKQALREMPRTVIGRGGSWLYPLRMPDFPAAIC